MVNPVYRAFQFQQSALRNVYCLSELWAETWFRLLERNAETLHAASGRRSVDHHDAPSTLPQGPDFSDHYGKRTSDVDVEHDL